MNYRLRDYIEELFANAPRTHKVYDLKDELLMNLNDKYKDLISQEKNEDEAFYIITSSIGDLNELLQGIGEVAVTAEKGERQRTAIIVSISVSLYIVAAAVLIFIEEVLGIHNDIGVVMMLVIAAIPTGLLIYHFMGKEKKECIPHEQQEWYENKNEIILEEGVKNTQINGTTKTKENRIFEAVSSIIWTLITVIYLWSSFALGNWAYSWILFILGAGIQSSIKLIMELKENNRRKNYDNICSIMWTIITAIYLWSSFTLGIWAYSWILFILGAAIQNIIKLAFELRES